MAALILRQPDLGSFLIILFAAIITYLAAGGRVLYMALAAPLVGIAGTIAILISDYRRARLLTFLNPTADPQGQGYHLNQILLALGSGGLFGSGIGQSRGKYEYLPEVTTDSIFAVIGEELGFIGAVVLIFLFGLLIYRGFRVAEKTVDPFGRVLAIGIVSTLAAQVVLNLAAMVSLVPLTGVPLPFISYGGTSLVVTLLSVGILLNISSQASA
jgi:cell division protein FtsW